MTDFQLKYLSEYFNSLTDSQRTKLLIQFFEELQMQEFVDCPTQKNLEEEPDLTPYWAHTGEPLI